MNALPAVVLVAALLGVWELYVELGSVDRLVLPAPHEVAGALWENAGFLASNLRPTAEEVVLGIVLALASGFALAVAIHLSPVLRRAVYPLAVGSQAVPIAVIAVLLIFWWGFGILPKLAVITLICFFPVLVTTVDGLASADPEQLKLLRTLDASRWQVFRHLEAPAALPGLLSGAKIAVAVAVIGAVLAEQAGSSDGLGHLLLQAIPQLETPRAYAAVVLLSALALLLFGALTLAERLAVPWAPRTKRRNA